MRKFFLPCLFIIGICWALFNFKGLANQGTFDTIVLDFREDIPATQIQSELSEIAQKYHVAPRLNSEFSGADHLYIVRGNQELLNTLKKSEVAKYTEYIEPDYQYKAFQTPNDPDYSKQWNLRSINIERAWDDTKGSGTTVAVIDTGVSRVPDLQNTQFVPGYDFVNDREEATDDNGHGTHVAGTIAQSTNNGYGVAGIAYEAKIMPLKVLSAYGGGTVADIAEAIKFAADNGADVINMSLGGGGESAVMLEAINYAHGKGVTIIAAAGNEDENSAAYPARYPHAIGVAALDASGQKAFYSNYGAGVDIAAPGGSTREGDLGGILQNTINPETGESIFAAYQGTSMAAPHVAGVAALIKASGVQDPDDIENVLKQSALAVTDDPLNHFGAGKLDAAAAVQLATKGQITFRDFFRWLRDNGYLNPRFWIDGGAVALLPKIAMVLGSYLLAWFLRNYFPFRWNWTFGSGLIAGSSGLFFLRGFYIFDLPQWPFRVMGSSIPELGGAISGSSTLNPIFASVAIPLALVLLLLGHRQWKWLAIGTAIGAASCLAISAAISPAVWGLGAGVAARAFLAVNALLCYGLARLALKTEVEPV
ncbi:MAG: S8 family peptidase [Oscillatoria sp. Prado101]|nr:S8 family peptidase [Oscillatoria sp. Prado101]